MLPDSIWNELFRFEETATDLACDGDQYGLTTAQMDKFNSICDDLADLIAELGLAEQK